MFLKVTVFFCFAVVVAVVAAAADVAAVAAAACAAAAVVDVPIADDVAVAAPLGVESAANVVELGWTVSVAASLVI